MYQCAGNRSEQLQQGKNDCHKVDAHRQSNAELDGLYRCVGQPFQIRNAPLPELMDRKKRDIMERKGDKEDENKRQKQQKESSAAAL